MRKKIKKFAIFVIVLILYMGLGYGMYSYLKYVYAPTTLTGNDKYIVEAVEISDIYGLDHVFGIGEDTYALICGEFTAIDVIHSKYYNEDFSYYREEESKDDVIVSTNEEVSTRYMVFDREVSGLNFNCIEPIHFGNIKDIRHNNIEYNYYVKKVTYTGTMLCHISGNTIEPIDFYKYSTIEKVKETAEDNSDFAENTFILIWLIILFIGLVSFDPSGDD